jgi:nucleotide-binding universal stress UspA family protein
MSTGPRRILVAVDGSEPSGRAVTEVISWVNSGFAGDVHLVTVHHPVHSAVSTFVGKDVVTDFHLEEGAKALESARAALDGAGISHQDHIGVGQPAETIVQFSRQLGVDGIVMGTRGLGLAAGALMGSVARDVIAGAGVPVTLIK